MGRPAVIISVEKQPSIDTVKLTREVERAIADLNQTMPKGIKIDNIRSVANAGADTFVAGSAIFGQPDYKTVIDAMRARLAA